jgi:endonuclease/exonuclease/phosphatase family metal-dependent hydrolase
MQDDTGPPELDRNDEAELARERDRAIAVVDDAVPATAKRLRMATYNIHKGVSAMSRHNRIHDLRAGLHALEADLIFLQEVQGRNDAHATRFHNWPELSQHTFLAGDRWAEAIYGKNSVRSDGDHGNAMLSRFRMVSHENIDISDHRFESRGLLHCAFDFDGTEIHCICAHLGLFEDSRARQADALIARIRSHVPAEAPLIIAGDFNDWRHRLGKRLVESLGVREVFSGHETRRAAFARRAAGYIRRTLDARGEKDGVPAGSVVSAAPKRRRIAAPARTFPSAFPLLRLDRVYVRGFRIASAQVLSGPTWARLSDHAPILAELVVE